MKKIGIVTSIDEKTGNIGVNKYYFLFASLFGEPVLIPHNSPVNKNLDLLILPGGADINPERYQKSPELFTQRPDIYKEYFDLHILPEYIEQRTPIFGICRGHQTLAVHFGMKLIQNFYSSVSEYKFGTTNESSYINMGHPKLDLIEDQILSRKILKHKHNGKNNVPFHSSFIYNHNSRHHQIIDESSLNENVSILAYHDTLFNIEGLIYENYPAITVQWHPEIFEDTLSVILINELLLN